MNFQMQLAMHLKIYAQKLHLDQMFLKFNFSWNSYKMDVWLTEDISSWSVLYLEYHLT